MYNVVAIQIKITVCKAIFLLIYIHSYYVLILLKWASEKIKGKSHKLFLRHYYHISQEEGLV